MTQTSVAPRRFHPEGWRQARPARQWVASLPLRVRPRVRVSYGLWLAWMTKCTWPRAMRRDHERRLPRPGSRASQALACAVIVGKRIDRNALEACFMTCMAQGAHARLRHDTASPRSQGNWRACEHEQNRSPRRMGASMTRGSLRVETCAGVVTLCPRPSMSDRASRSSRSGGLTRPIPHEAPVAGAPRKAFAKKKASIASVASGPFASV